MIDSDIYGTKIWKLEGDVLVCSDYSNGVDTYIEGIALKNGEILITDSYEIKHDIEVK